MAVDSAGNVYVADTLNDTIRKVTPSGVVTTLAGLAGSRGSADGTGSAARFYWPQGVAVDGAGNVYVADSGNNTIRKVTPSGVVTTLAGLAGSQGSADGTGSAARFFSPVGVAVDSAGNVFVADNGNDTIRKFTPDGVVTTLAGHAGNLGSADGTNSAARFWDPAGVALDSAGNVYVADSANNTIRKVTSGGVVTTLAGCASCSSGSAEGAGNDAHFYRPYGVAVDSAANLYVADEQNDTIRIGTTNSCPDAPTIDLAVGPVGQLRQLDTSPQTAVAWHWGLVREPSASSAVLSAANVRNPTFTPDVADLYVFQLEATNAAGGICIRTLAFSAYAASARPTILLNDGAFGIRSDHFGFDVSAAAGQAVVVTDLDRSAQLDGLGHQHRWLQPVLFQRPASAKFTTPVLPRTVPVRTPGPDPRRFGTDGTRALARGRGLVRAVRRACRRGAIAGEGVYWSTRPWSMVFYWPLPKEREILTSHELPHVPLNGHWRYCLRRSALPPTASKD